MFMKKLPLDVKNPDRNAGILVSRAHPDLYPTKHEQVIVVGTA